MVYEENAVRRAENERQNPRTAQSFCVPREEIAATGSYDLSLNRYKEVVREDVAHRTPRDILAELKRLEAEIIAMLGEVPGTASAA